MVVGVEVETSRKEDEMRIAKNSLRVFEAEEKSNLGSRCIRVMRCSFYPLIKAFTIGGVGFNAKQVRKLITWLEDGLVEMEKPK